MAGNNVKTVVLRGKASFAKILGEPVLNYDKSGKEWKMDLVLDKNTVKELKAYGIADRVKSKENYLDGQPFLSFKHSELKRDGTPNFPISVKDIRDQSWPEDRLIGNGSDVEVKFVVIDNGPGKKAGVYLRAVRVLNLVPYERKEFAPLAEDDEFADNLAEAERLAAAQAEKRTQAPEDSEPELDDEMPV